MFYILLWIGKIEEVLKVWKKKGGKEEEEEEEEEGNFFVI